MIDNYHMEKYDSYTRRCYLSGGAPGSFDYIADEVKQYITEFTFIVHRPVFTFPNGIVVSMCYSDDPTELRWKYCLKFNAFATDWMLDVNFKDFSDKLYNFSDLLRCFLLLPQKEVEAWTKTLNNPRRKTWKTSQEFLESKKFRDAFEKVIDKAIQDGKAEDPFRFPENDLGFSEPELNDLERPTKYECRKIINDEQVLLLTAYKWKRIYSIGFDLLVDCDNKFKTIDFETLKEVREFVESLKDKEAQEIKRMFLIESEPEKKRKK